MPKIDITAIPARQGSIYPGSLGDIVAGRLKHALGDAAGLDQFGVNLTRLAPGSASAHRHWHAHEDEFVFILSGEAVLIEDDGNAGVSETIMTAGDAAGFKAGVAKGHHLVNRSQEDVTVLEIGTRVADDDITYTDNAVDMRVERRDHHYRVMRKDGTKSPQE